MNRHQLLPFSLLAQFEVIKQYILVFWRTYWVRIFLILVVGLVMYFKDISIGIQFTDTEVVSSRTESNTGDSPQAMNTSLISRESPNKIAVKTSTNTTSNGPDIGNTYSNMSYTTKGIHTGDKSSKRTKKRKKQLAYVAKYKGIATKEMNKYGIPASITLAQGLLESNVGESKLATRNNNHFGMKCFSKRCKRGHCSNFEDDSHKDFFRIYKSVDESYRAHSLLLKNGKRYRRLFSYRPSDYKSWAKGLKTAGYATDPRYAEKLINLIEDLDLDNYDR